MFPAETYIKGLTDSKKITEPFRENTLIDMIYKKALFRMTVVVSAAEIDAFGVGVMWKRSIVGMAEAAHWWYPNDKIILDGNKLVGLDYVEPVVRADGKFASVSAASNIAKYTQCCAMDDLARRYPRYGFSHNRGYGTPEHRAKLKEHGVCPDHRMSYNPMKEMV